MPRVSSSRATCHSRHPHLVLYLHLLGFSHTLPSCGGGRPLSSPFIMTHQRSRKTSGPFQIDLRGLWMPNIAHPVTDGKLLASPHIPFMTTSLQLFNLPLYRDVDKLSLCSMREEGIGPCFSATLDFSFATYDNHPTSAPTASCLFPAFSPHFRVSLSCSRRHLIVSNMPTT